MNTLRGGAPIPSIIYSIRKEIESSQFDGTSNVEGVSKAKHSYFL